MIPERTLEAASPRLDDRRRGAALIYAIPALYVRVDELEYEVRSRAQRVIVTSENGSSFFSA
jgi:hypothetical protein